MMARAEGSFSEGGFWPLIWRSLFLLDSKAAAMSPTNLRTVLFLGSVGIAAYWPVAFVFGLWAYLIWSYPRDCRTHAELLRLHRDERSAFHLIAGLRRDLILARQELAARERDLEEARSGPREMGGGHPVFQRVGLTENCPRFVAEVARREFRRRLHPDGQPSRFKAEAEKRFKEAEQVFDQIWALRGF